mgnify:CR=1 FL=1
MTSAGSVVATQLSFLAVEGGSIPTPALQFTIRRISHETGRLWIEKWHYSHRMPTGQNIIFGLYNEELGVLYAVIVYGIGVNTYQAQFLGVEKVMELKRMARSEPRQSYPLSRFIALTLKMLRKSCDFDAVVAFADPEQGHEGTVYKATGFTHEGMSNAEWHTIDDAGEVRHRRFAFRYARRNGVTIEAARIALGLQREQTAPKHRWVRRA